MAKSTFINLSNEKKDRITEALLKEFSTYPLQKAQVARIIKDSGIARGAFYKYFVDLYDAYQYLYSIALKDIHSYFTLHQDYEPQSFYINVKNFVEQTLCSKYAKLVKMHLLYNESFVGQPFSSDILVKLSPQNWSAMVLSHAAIREILENPSLKEAVLAHLKAGLILLKKR